MIVDNNVIFRDSEIMEPMVVICPGRPDEMSLVENYFNSDMYIRDNKFENDVNAHAARKVFIYCNVM